jgi:SpoVK/Ycf46/Vps4 family AAA+-type ATPase
VQLSVPKPSFEARHQIVGRLMSPLDLEDVEIRVLAWLSDGMSGADLESLIVSIKKALVLRADDETHQAGLIPLVRQILLLHSGRMAGSDRTAALHLDAADLSKTLMRASDLRLHQSDLATLFKKNKGTVSRWLRDDSHDTARVGT